MVGKQSPCLEEKRYGFSLFQLWIAVCEDAESAVLCVQVARQVDAFQVGILLPQLPEFPTLVNNTQLIAEMGTSERPELALQMQMNTPAASSICTINV